MLISTSGFVKKDEEEEEEGRDNNSQAGTEMLQESEEARVSLGFTHKSDDRRREAIKNVCADGSVVSPELQTHLLEPELSPHVHMVPLLHTFFSLITIPSSAILYIWDMKRRRN